MFELETMQKAKVLDVRVLAKKDRKPGEDAGAQLLLQADMSADILSAFDGALKGQLFQRAAQASIEGAETLDLSTTGAHVKRLRWEYEQTGCHVEIDRGLGGKRNLTLADCRVHRILISPRPGGTVVLQWTVDAPAVSDETRGKLTGLKATEIELTIAGPDPSAQSSIGNE